MVEESKLLTLAEAARLVRLRPRTLANWARGPNPRIPVVRLGRRVLFDRVILEDWIRRQIVHPLGNRDDVAIGRIGSSKATK
jgi:hypothetical protein